MKDLGYIGDVNVTYNPTSVKNTPYSTRGTNINSLAMTYLLNSECAQLANFASLIFLYIITYQSCQLFLFVW